MCHHLVESNTKRGVLKPSLLKARIDIAWWDSCKKCPRHQVDKESLQLKLNSLDRFTTMRFP